jgi:RNA polymerase sigma-70 factor (ECF subfamily)
VNTATDIEIIQIVLAGDTAMYSVLVNRYKNKVFSLAYAIVSNREDAEEIAQDAFVKAFKGLPSFEERSSFSTWMYRIVVNTALNKKKLKKLLTVDDTDWIKQDEPFGFDSLTAYLKAGDQKKFIRIALDALNQQEKLCLTLFYLSELSVKEIQEITGILESNIKVLLLRGRKHLYEQLKKLLKSEVKNLI